MTKKELSKLEKYLMNVYKLKNVIRYNTRNIIRKESVAEHSFYVALFALKICDEYGVSDKVKQNALVKALLHDMPEIELNDITHNVKEKLHLRPLLKTYEDEYFDKHYAAYAKLMNEGEALTDAIVLLADNMSVYQYVLNEHILGNSSDDIVEILDNSKKRIVVHKKKLERILKGTRE